MSKIIVQRRLVSYPIVQDDPYAEGAKIVEDVTLDRLLDIRGFTSGVGCNQAGIQRSEAAHTDPATAGAGTQVEQSEAPTQAGYSPATDISRTSRYASSS